MCVVVPHLLPKGLLRPLLDTPSLGADQVLNLPSTIQSYRRLIPRQRRRMTSPLQHLPMSEQPAVRSQIKEASKLPRYPHGHVMETTSSRPTVRRLDAVSVSPLNYSQVRIRSPCTHRSKKFIEPACHSTVQRDAVNIVDVLFLFHASTWYTLWRNH